MERETKLNPKFGATDDKAGTAGQVKIWRGLHGEQNRGHVLEFIAHECGGGHGPGVSCLRARNPAADGELGQAARRAGQQDGEGDWRRGRQGSVKRALLEMG